MNVFQTLRKGDTKTRVYYKDIVRLVHNIRLLHCYNFGNCYSEMRNDSLHNQSCKSLIFVITILDHQCCNLHVCFCDNLSDV